MPDAFFRVFAPREKDIDGASLSGVAVFDTACSSASEITPHIDAPKGFSQGGFVLHGFLNPPNEITAGLDILPAL